MGLNGESVLFTSISKGISVLVLVAFVAFPMHLLFNITRKKYDLWQQNITTRSNNSSAGSEHGASRGYYFSSVAVKGLA
jgi:hypothetical protein